MSFRIRARRVLAAVPLVLSAAVVSSQTPAPTLFGQIDDQAERAAFRTLWATEAPEAQHRLAMAFLTRYPRSIVTREALELAARASQKLGNLEEALARAQESLRLLPENPFLLVMTADIAARMGRSDVAEPAARDALRYLTHAYAPLPLTPAEWPQVRDGLRSNAYFVLGRVAAGRGDYPDARRSLLMAVSLDPDDPEALYTLGVVQQALGETAAAAGPLARVLGVGGPLAAPARQLLETLHAGHAPAGVAFDAYVASQQWTPPQPAARAASPPAGAYAGSTACRDCHGRIYESWRATGMANMLRAYTPEVVFGDFSGNRTIDGSARPMVADSRHVFEIRDGATGRWTRYPVDYVIGSKWQQAYATRLPDSRILVFPVQYSRLKGAWLNYWSLVDGPDSPRTDISKFHEIPDNAVYQTSCAPCHTSQLKAFEEFRESGVNCEMCHGPSRDHIARVKAGSTERRAFDTPLRFRQAPQEQYLAVCAQCHAQSAIHDAESSGAVNYSERVPFYRTYPVHLPSDFSRKALYGDGRYRATTFISESLARTACVRRGGATCGSCHDPHPPDAASNPTSLKFPADPDRMCLQCHTALADAPERHTRHAPGSEGSRCVSCHMPRIMDALLFPARTHEIDDIPDVEMTERFGQADSPNACLLCHTDRGTDWVRQGR